MIPFADGQPEGCVNGSVFGTYLHGLFDTGELTEELTVFLCKQKGIAPEAAALVPMEQYRQQQFDLLADGVRGRAGHGRGLPGHGNGALRWNRDFLHLYYGDGKGKTTAAMGLALRALGSGKRVVIVQFLKGGNSGEIPLLAKLGAEIYRGQGGAEIRLPDE